mmetsp:Transcript_41628/g.54833  ORF Transcript_41628/g.54833 Transcript_41628/m.54833 type:complete len:114 (+) Transcript_41628:132-473(+)|eukprot:CAMPEP_0185569484 /NCGR_PEP_ID=MMETSP0434-20130131/2085_1 /TAXON_ID=626734 ORGANISM="Favella taraikaensis, Strain Fe Narragansett Bay" /NCGR_SAMPLE_ID=MMETSP0434 /ASSEMBLY_ACC=CAM_ASM_000379 /LENGTH=113 /DNA_ID=CAMNT_0028184273 /DNA_START=132 /DNA_END=473 /DNA_ORIENTATION=-
MDDVIYFNFRKNIIMPIQMVCVKSPTGKIDTEDLKEVASGTKSFIEEIRPHALVPSNAKELMLKDAEYSTPQDHYFGYTQKSRAALDSGMSMPELKEATRNEEVQIIAELYGD